MISKPLSNLNCPSERWKSYFQGHKFQAFRGVHAPRTPLTAPACGGRLPETPYVKPGSAPAVFQHSSSVKWTADI